MSLPRLFIASPHAVPVPGLILPLGLEEGRHLGVLRLRPGDALELVLPSGVWRADLVEVGKRGASARLVGPLDENREPPFAIEAWIPVTAQLALWDEMLPAAVELGATLIQPVAFARSEFDPRKTEARMERWSRIIRASAEQSHRSRLPELRTPLPFEALLALDMPQKWVAYELPTGDRNPELRSEAIAFTHGPEGGITNEEALLLRKAGWTFLSLGSSILRAVTCPAAILGAVRYEWGKRNA
jgi:16S rRNA (uracil1498-N3)-methyltransferase